MLEDFASATAEAAATDPGTVGGGGSAVGGSVSTEVVTVSTEVEVPERPGGGALKCPLFFKPGGGAFGGPLDFATAPGCGGDCGFVSSLGRVPLALVGGLRWSSGFDEAIL